MPTRRSRGRSGEFTIRIIAVQEKIVPPKSPLFSRQLGDFENEEALRAKLRKRLEEDALEQAKNEAHGKAIETLIKDNPFDVPPSRIEAFIDYMMEQAAREQRPGEPLPTREEISRRYREIAVRTIKRQRIIDYIAHKEKIAATQEEVDAEIQTACRAIQPAVRNDQADAPAERHDAAHQGGSPRTENARFPDSSFPVLRKSKFTMELCVHELVEMTH